MSKKMYQPRLVLAGMLATLTLSVVLPVFGKEAVTPPKTSGEGETGLPLHLDRALPSLSPRPDRPDSPILQVDPDEDVAMNQLNSKLQHLEQQQAELQARYIKLLSNNKASKHEPPAQWPYYFLVLLMLGGATAWVLRGPSKKRTSSRPAQSNLPKKLERVSPEINTLGTKPLLDPPPVKNESLDLRVQTGSQISTTIKEQTAALIAQGQHQSAILLLEDHIRKDPESSPLPWLLLLELLHRAKTKDRYEYKRRQCKLYFNVDIPKYGSASRETKGIESYRHVMSELIRLWHGDGIKGYLDSLLRDSRDGGRAGFNIRAYNDLLLLHSIVQEKAGLKTEKFS